MPDERIALVTGAASGVGLETVTLLAQRGQRVLGVDLAPRPSGLDGPMAWVCGDVSDPGTWRAALATSSAEFGAAPDVLVLNAAALVVGKLLDTPPEAFRAVLEVNVQSAVLGLHACLPAMIERGSGSVVAIASTASLVAEQDLAAYATSKAALLQLVRSTAIDYAHTGVRINAVCPTSIDTPFLRRQTDNVPDPKGFWDAMVDRHPLGRILQPVEVARVVEFLISPAASGMVGASVVVDCGLTAAVDFTHQP